MVVGQRTEEPAGMSRMVPGESSSPDNVPVPVSSVDTRDARVVPGVSREDPPLPTASINLSASPG